MLRTSSRRFHKVAVIGANGGIGQPMSLLFAGNPRCSELAMMDVEKFALGSAADVSHCDFPCNVTGYAADDVEACLTDAEVVVVPAGVPRKPGMTRQDLFGKNAGIAAQVGLDVAKYCPNAIVGIICNPVNSTVPIVAEMLKRQGVYQPNKLMGITTLDVVRANKFVGDLLSLEATHLDITCIGGHSGPTIVPILSELAGMSNNTHVFSDADRAALTKRIQYGGDEVVQAKDKAGGGSATLSMAWAATKWLDTVLMAMDSQITRAICAYTESPREKTPFFSLRCQMGENGIKEVHPAPLMNSFEQDLYAACVPELQKNIQAGLDFAKDFKGKA